MSEPTVAQLFRRAVRDSDEAAMREGGERLFAHGGPETLSPEAEFQLRHEDYVMEMPQSGERTLTRDVLREVCPDGRPHAQLG